MMDQSDVLSRFWKTAAVKPKMMPSGEVAGGEGSTSQKAKAPNTRRPMQHVGDDASGTLQATPRLERFLSLASMQISKLLAQVLADEVKLMASRIQGEYPSYICEFLEDMLPL
jgi:hypothetical protein